MTGALTEPVTLTERIRLAALFGSPMEPLLEEVETLQRDAGAAYRTSFVKMAVALEPFRLLANFLATKEAAGHYREPLQDKHTVITLHGGGGSASVTVGDLRELVKVVRDTQALMGS